MLRGFIAIDQSSQHYYMTKYPRKELLQQLGKKHAAVMYCDLKTGGYRRVGYVIGGHWLDIYEVHDVAKWGQIL